MRPCDGSRRACEAAMKRIVELEAENKRLREALAEMIDAFGPIAREAWDTIGSGILGRACAALKPAQGEEGRA